VLESGLPAVVIRPSHVYGPGGWYAEELVPALRQPGRFAVIGSGANLWDVVHVDDVVAALVLGVDAALRRAGRIHVADDQPISFYDFMALTADALGVGPAPADTGRPRAADRRSQRRRCGDARRAPRTPRSRRELGWQAAFPDAREGVPDAIARLGLARSGA
jgi:nucleoside-diphosphate-sugar epimerase